LPATDDVVLLLLLMADVNSFFSSWSTVHKLQWTEDCSAQASWHTLLYRPDLRSCHVHAVAGTFFDYNSVNCKATLILEIKNLRNKKQYKPK